jgi:hypothetical protein
VKKGAEDLIKSRPDWLPSYHQYAFLAKKYEDLETVRELFKRPQLAWYEDANSVWFDRRFFEALRMQMVPGAQTGPPGGRPSPLPPLPVTTLPRPAIGPVLLDTRLEYGTEQHSVTAFLVETPKGTVAVSALPASLSVVQNQFKSWEMRGPDRSARPYHVKSFIAHHAPEGYRGIALRLDRATEGTFKPLRMRKGPVAQSERIYLVSCRAGGEKCEQEVLDARPMGIDVGRAGTSSYTSYFLNVPAGLTRVLGSAVVDSKGEVIAVVTRRQPPSAGEPQVMAESLKIFLEEE